MPLIIASSQDPQVQTLILSILSIAEEVVEIEASVTAVEEITATVEE